MQGYETSKFEKVGNFYEMSSCLIFAGPVTHMKDMGVHIRKIMRACDTTDMYHANYKPIAHGGQLITQDNIYETNN